MAAAPTIAQIVRHYVQAHGAGQTLDELGNALRAKGQKGSSSAISDWINGKRAPSSRAQVEALRDIVGCRHWKFDVDAIRRAWPEAPNKSDARDGERGVGTDDSPPTASVPSTRRRNVLRIALLGGVAVIPAAIWGPGVVRHLAEGMGRPPSARLSIVNSQVVYLPAEDDLGSIIDVRLRNEGGATSQVHRITMVVEQIERFQYRPCAQGCLPRTGSQAAVVYSVSLGEALPGQTIVRDVGLTVEPASVQRMALAFAGTTPNTCAVARLRVSLEADGQPQMDVVTAHIFMVTGPPKGEARRLTDRQLALTLQDAALPVLTPKDVRGELIGRGLPVPTWLDIQ